MNISLIVAASSITVVMPFMTPSASALAETLVTPVDSHGWMGIDDNGHGGSQSYEVGPGSAPLGYGSAELSVSATDQGDLLFKSAYGGTKLADVSALSYATYVQTGNGTIAPSVQINVTSDVTAASTWQGRLVYEPYMNGAVVDGTWQTWDAKAGKWWLSKPDLFGNNCGQAAPCTMSELIALYPNIGVNTGLLQGVGFKAGSGWTSFVGNVDAFAFNTDVYNFDPYVPAPTAVPVKPSLSGEVIYDAISSVLPSNYGSLGFEATSTSALGDKISFAAGTGRNLKQVAVTLSSWACESGDWTTQCVTTPGATFTHPLTFNIYSVAADGTAGTLLGSRTQTFTIPYRPSADPTCVGGQAWRDTDGACWNGYNYVVVFDFTGVTVPDTIIYSVAYDTQHYGASPTGVNGAYDSLNVGLNDETSAPYVGIDLNTDELYWDTTYPGYTAGLKADSNWDPYTVAATFTAVSPAITPVTPTTPIVTATTGGTGATTIDTAVLAAEDTTDTTPTTTGSVSATDDKDSQASVAGTSDKKSDNGVWNLLGFAWYWWLVAALILAGLWWFIVAWRRRKGDAQQ